MDSLDALKVFVLLVESRLNGRSLNGHVSRSFEGPQPITRHRSSHRGQLVRLETLGSDVVTARRTP